MQLISKDEAKDSVGSGWSPLIDHLYKILPKNTEVLQVKEKFGTLRFYHNSSDPTFRNMVNEVEAGSGIVCEDCGRAGKTRNLPSSSWLKTICDSCYQALKNATFVP